MSEKLSRRRFLRVAAVGAGALLAASCQPKVVEKIVGKEVTKIVKEVVKETVIVAGTPQVVEKEVTKVVKEIVKETVIVEREAKQAPEREIEVTCIWRQNPSEVETMKEAFRIYSEAHPNVSVEYLPLPQTKEAWQKLLGLFAGGTPPEVFASVIGSGGTVSYMYQGLLTNLTPYIERDGYDQSDFFEVAPKTFTFGGKQFGLPRGGVATGLFLNLDMFEKEGIDPPPTNLDDPDWTWDRMVEMAKQFTQDTDGDGRLDQYGLIFGHFNFNQYQMLWDTDTLPQATSEYGITRTHNLRDPLVIECFQRGADLVWKDKCSPTKEASEALQALGPGGTFLSGRIAMWAQIAGPTAAKDAPFEVGVAAFPRGAPDIQQRVMTWTGPLCVGLGCTEPETAWDLTKYLCSVEGQRIVAPGAFIGTSRKSLHKWWAGLFGIDADDLIDVEISGYAHAGETPNCRTAGYDEVSHILGSGLDPLWLGDKSAEECALGVADELEAKLIEIYDDNVEKARSLGFLG